MRTLLMVTGWVVLLGSSLAAESITIDQVHALDQQCEAARVAKLKPIRARKVEQCVANGQRSREECATFFSTYGNNSSRVHGGVVRGSFYDLPQCVTAKKALKKMQAVEGSQ
ncbi:MAG: hypothetical protein ACR2GP_07030 [Burkholderiaceae bacterium]